MKTYYHRELRNGKPYFGEQFGQFLSITQPITISVDDPVLEEAKYRLEQVIKNGALFDLEIRDQEFIVKPPLKNDPLNIVTTVGAKWIYFGRAWQVKRIQSRGKPKRTKKVWCGRRRKKKD